MATSSDGLTYTWLPLSGEPSDALTYCWGAVSSGEQLVPLLGATASLAGPSLGEYECTLGFACAPRVEGLGLGPTNKVPGRFDGTKIVQSRICTGAQKVSFRESNANDSLGAGHKFLDL